MNLGRRLRTFVLDVAATTSADIALTRAAFVAMDLVSGQVIAPSRSLRC